MFIGVCDRIYFQNRCQPPPWPQSPTRTPAGLRHGVTEEADHYPYDLCDQGSDSTVGDSLYIPLTTLTKAGIFAVQRATVCGLAAWTCRMGVGMLHEHGFAAWAWA